MFGDTYVLISTQKVYPKKLRVGLTNGVLQNVAVTKQQKLNPGIEMNPPSYNSTLRGYRITM